MKWILFVFLILTIAGPIWILASGKIDFKADWRTANRASALLAPDPKKNPEAIVQVYAAPAFNWRGLFAVHTWIAVKPKNSTQYTVYDVIGWRVLRNLAAYKSGIDIPDRFWFSQKPNIIYDLRGLEAEKIIPKIDQIAGQYPYPKQYDAWPGPNSNTFTAYVGRGIPEMKLTLPSNALGKDYLENSFFAPTPSGTGYQVSIYGLLGLTLAQKEGLEINILGLVYGLGLDPLAIKLPGFGDIYI